MEILSDTVFHGDSDFRGTLKFKKIFSSNASADEIGDYGIYADKVIACSQLRTRSLLSGDYNYFNLIFPSGNIGTSERNLYLCRPSNDLYVDFESISSDISGIKCNYLSTSTASSTYLSKTNAASTYLSKTDAASTYVKKVDSLKYKRVPIDFDVPANCTKFITAIGTGVPAGNVLSLSLLKSNTITFGSTTCGATKQVQADVWAISGGEHFVVEKSSAFAISSSDLYEISAVYY